MDNRIYYSPFQAKSGKLEFHKIIIEDYNRKSNLKEDIHISLIFFILEKIKNQFYMHSEFSVSVKNKIIKYYKHKIFLTFDGFPPQKNVLYV